MADSAPTPALEAQRSAHAELGELIDELQKYTNSKLYHQLTMTILKYLVADPFVPSKPGAAKGLAEFFETFVKGFASKFDKVKWVQILSIVCKPQTPEAALAIISPFESEVEGNRDSKYLWQALKAEKLVANGNMDESKDLLEALGKEIEIAYEIDAVIQSQYHKTNALMWKKLERWADFYKSSILYMAFTPVSAIPAEERAGIAFEVAVAAFRSDEAYDFGELMQQELFSSLDGSEHAWIKEVMHAFSEGKFDLYDAVLQKFGAKLEATPGLKGTEQTVLRPKMAVLSLMELAFRKPKKQRRLTFDELALHCRVGPKEVEHLVMKSMSQKLIKGSIDEVEKLVLITWVKPRILDNMRIDLMRERMDDWAHKTGLLLQHLEEMTPELLVS